MKLERAPCIRCQKCPVRPGQWGKYTISEACRNVNKCTEWEK